MTKKIYDLVAKVGSYTVNGDTKGRYVNAGSVMQKDDGSKFVLLDRTFNPAGVPNPEDRPNIILSLYEPKDSRGGGTGVSQDRPKPSQPSSPDDDDIPF